MDILDRELDDIYNATQNRKAQELIQTCVTKYTSQGDDSSKLNEMLQQILDPKGLDPYVTKTVFKNAMKEFINLHSRDDICESPPKHMSTPVSVPVSVSNPVYASTPLHTKETHFKRFGRVLCPLEPRKLSYPGQDSISTSSSSIQCPSNNSCCHLFQEENRELVHKVTTLESNLFRSEQKLNSFEKKLHDCQHEASISLQRQETEILKLKSLISELEQKNRDMEDKLGKSENEFLIANRFLEETQEKCSELQVELTSARTELLVARKEINQLKYKSNSLEKEVFILHDIQLKLENTENKMQVLTEQVKFYEKENSSLKESHREMIETISELRFEKSSLQAELAERAASITLASGFEESLQFELHHSFEKSVSDNVSSDEDRRESGIDVHTCDGAYVCTSVQTSPVGVLHNIRTFSIGNQTDILVISVIDQESQTTIVSPVENHIHRTLDLRTVGNQIDVLNISAIDQESQTTIVSFNSVENQTDPALNLSVTELGTQTSEVRNSSVANQTDQLLDISVSEQGSQTTNVSVKDRGSQSTTVRTFSIGNQTDILDISVIEQESQTEIVRHRSIDSQTELLVDISVIDQDPLTIGVVTRSIEHQIDQPLGISETNWMKIFTMQFRTFVFILFIIYFILYLCLIINPNLFHVEVRYIRGPPPT